MLLQTYRAQSWQLSALTTVAIVWPMPCPMLFFYSSLAVATSRPLCDHTRSGVISCIQRASLVADFAYGVELCHDERLCRKSEVLGRELNHASS